MGTDQVVKKGDDYNYQEVIDAWHQVCGKSGESGDLYKYCNFKEPRALFLSYSVLAGAFVWHSSCVTGHVHVYVYHNVTHIISHVQE